MSNCNIPQTEDKKEELYPLVIRNDLVEVKTILTKHPHCVNRLYCGETLLDYPCRFGNTEMVNLLLECGIQVNNCNKIGNPPMVYAITYDHFDILKILVESKAKVEGLIVQDNLTMMDLAILHGRYDAATYIYNLLVNKEVKSAEEYEQVAKKYFLKYVNYEMFIEAIKNGKPQNEAGDFLTRPMTPVDTEKEEEVCCGCCPLAWFVYRPQHKKPKVEQSVKTDKSEKASAPES
jgi:ankyrin repeat protein